eukprot:COSAG01_NODE_70140_length_259_cov_0.962500_2_plen_31_part_01
MRAQVADDTNAFAAADTCRLMPSVQPTVIPT